MSLSERAIERDIVVGGKFLKTLSTKSYIRTILGTEGYNEREHAIGWSLYLRLMGYKPEAAQQPAIPAAAEAATAKLDNMDGPLFVRTTATLERGNPNALEYFLRGGLKAASGAASVGVMRAYADRYVALRDGTDPAREATREADTAATQLLADRNIFTPAREVEVRELIGIATTLAPQAPAATPTSQDEVEYAKAAEEFHAWLKEWRTTARTVVTRRDYQVMLGVATRRAAATDDDDAEDDDYEPMGV